MSAAPGTACLTERRSQRFKVNFPIKLFAVLGQRRCVLQGQSHDLSEQGMATYIPADLEVGAMVQIEFMVPRSNQRLGVTGIVRDSSGFRCGVEFQNLTPTDQKALTDCCEKLGITA